MNMMKAYLACAGFAIAVSVAPAAFAKSDKEFLAEAIQGDMAEVAMGKLAQQNGASEATRAFGATLVKDHGAHQKKVEALAKTMGVTAPTKMSDDAQSTYDRLAKLNGAKFDEEFADHMVEDHKKDIDTYEDQTSAKGDVGMLARETLPTLKAHLATAETLHKQAD